MFINLITLIASFLLLAPASIAQFSAPQPKPSTAQVQPTPSQVQACIAALPHAPKPPQPPVNLFPGVQQRIDEMIRKAGGDPVAMRKAGFEAALQKYADAKAVYDGKRLACSAPIVVPVAPVAIQPNPFLPTVPPVAPASPVVSAAPAQTQQPK